MLCHSTRSQYFVIVVVLAAAAAVVVINVVVVVVVVVVHVVFVYSFTTYDKVLDYKTVLLVLCTL